MHIQLKDSNIEYIVVDGIKYFNLNHKENFKMEKQEKKRMPKHIRFQVEMLAKTYLDSLDGKFSFSQGIELLKKCYLTGEGMTVKTAKEEILKIQRGNKVINEAKAHILAKQILKQNNKIPNNGKCS